MTPKKANLTLPVLALSLLLVSSTPAGQNKTERERDGLQGSVHRVRVERESLADRSKQRRVTYSEDCYDQKGNKVLCGQVESSTTLDGGTVKWGHSKVGKCQRCESVSRRVASRLSCLTPFTSSAFCALLTCREFLRRYPPLLLWPPLFGQARTVRMSIFAKLATWQGIGY